MVNEIKLLVLDIDGVVTDGRVSISASATPGKRIAFVDLDALTRLRNTGCPVAFLTGESDESVDLIAGRFNVKEVVRGAKDKLKALKGLSERLGIPLESICYVGDSDRDAGALAAAGLGLAPANATAAAKAAADRVLSNTGGAGAVAEAVALLLRLNGEAAEKPALMTEMRRIVEDSVSAHQRLIPESLETLADVATVFVRAIRSGNKILLFGNGGSAADAQHVAGELVGRFLRESAPWPAIALTTDSSILTCVGNDWEFADVFARQVRALVKPGDVVVGISTSGKSPNVLRGLRDGKEREAVCIGFTGANGESMREVADICFCAPSDCTPRIQECHLVAWHAICELVERTLLDAKS